MDNNFCEATRGAGLQSVSIPFVAQHFGKWVTRLWRHSGVNQQVFAEALGLGSYVAVAQMRKKAERERMRPRTLAGFMAMCDVANEEEFDRYWTAGNLPDPAQLLERIEKCRLLSLNRKAMEARMKTNGQAKHDSALFDEIGVPVPGSLDPPPAGAPQAEQEKKS